MHREVANPGRDFDKIVKEYNDWLVSLQDLSKKKNGFLHNFIGAGSFRASGNSKKLVKLGNPLHFRRNLCSEQKEAVALASDLRRVQQRLDGILVGDLSISGVPLEKAESGKEMIAETYEHLRNVYVYHAYR